MIGPATNQGRFSTRPGLRGLRHGPLLRPCATAGPSRRQLGNRAVNSSWSKRYRFVLSLERCQSESSGLKPTNQRNSRLFSSCFIGVRTSAEREANRGAVPIFLAGHPLSAIEPFSGGFWAFQ